jgi:integrase/recombinase XerD
MTEHTVLVPSPKISRGLVRQDMPRAVRDAGPAAAFAWDEYFSATLRNPHTRAAYSRAVRNFLMWLEPRSVPLTQLTPGIVGSYFDGLETSVPTQKLALAAIRRFFDVMVQRHVMFLNPAASVRGERYEVVEGKTPEVSPEQARSLLKSINAKKPAGLRDRAIIATLIYTAARAGAVAKLRQKDLTHDGTQYSLRFAEKGGKQREIPVRHDLQGFILDYLKVASPEAVAPTTPLFQSLRRKTGVFTGRPMSGTDVWRMVKRQRFPGHRIGRHPDYLFCDSDSSSPGLG